MATVPAYTTTATTEPWYRLEAEDAIRRLDSSREGLSQEEAEERLRRFGPNRLERQKGPNPFVLFLRQFQSPLVYVLVIAGIVTALVGEYVDTAVILVVVVVNAVIGYVQETKAAAAMEALLKMTAPTATVVRGGVHTEIELAEVVPGDIVLLASGDKVPADQRLLEAHNLQIDEAPLTGESVPVAKTTRAIQETNIPPADQLSVAFAGTTVTAGRGVGMVVATGTHTELGKISQQVTGLEVVETPLQARLHNFSRVLGIAVLGLVLLVFILGVLAGFGLLEMFLTAVTLAVSAIPEGLPATVTIILAIGTRRMAERNAIIRKLPAVETLGTADFICTDKTGTLTRNEMTVRTIYAGRRCYEVTGAGYEPKGRIMLDSRRVKASDSPALEMLLTIGALANDANMARQDGTVKVLGDPTEGALLVAAEKGDLHLHQLRRSRPRLAEIPFESEQQYMATLNRFDAQPTILVKGAPGRVLEMCSSQLLDTGRAPLDREEVLEEGRQMADQGYRVLALAYKPSRSQKLTAKEATEGLIFAGLVGIIDPPRPEAAEAVEGARRAGVRVAMITGDHRQTAAAIARQLHILKPGQRVLTGRDLETMPDDQLDRVVEEIAVYARAAPEHKTRIVERLKARGHIVAVTGDGVNDAPALRAADIGVSMGITGTDVSKETADMVLADDNFATIFAAIEEGRVVFENIRKAIYFLLATNVGEVLTILVALVVGLPLPLVPVQILWVNLVTDSAPVIALGFEPGEREYLLRPPRHPKSEMLSRVLQMRILLVSTAMAIGTLGLFAAQLASGTSLTEARTIAFTTLVLFQFFDALNARSVNQSIFTKGPTTNPYLIAGILLGLSLQLAVIYVPFLQPILQTTALDTVDWLAIVAVASLALVLVEIEKAIRRRTGTTDLPTAR
ncbi:MAG: cation-translocating P-type ATPase [Chloroflexota bacterium]